MSWPKAVFGAIGFLLGYIVVGNLLGVLICFIADVVPLRQSSSLLPYAVWFVIGVFIGFLSYAHIGGWITRKDDIEWMDGDEFRWVGNLILGTTFVLLAALSGLFYIVFWKTNYEVSSFIPDSPPLTIMFFVTIVVSMLLAKTVFAPRKNKR